MRNYIIFLMIFVAAITSCSGELTEELMNTDVTHTSRMIFNGSIGSYNDEVTTRAAVSIADGTKLYLVFKNGSYSVNGTAIYHSTEKEWSLTYNGSLSGSGTCSAYYIPDATEQDGTVELSSSTKVYGSTSGSYTYASDGSITVSATLPPMLSRFRLKGIEKTYVRIEGVKLPTTFMPADGSIQCTSTVVPIIVNSDGYTDYIYYVEPSSDSLIIINGTKQYSIKMPLKSGGIAGFINVPTECDHGGWQMKNKPFEEPKTVDLDLPSGTLWATFNVGASVPEEYGLYFAWGETTGYTSDANTADQHWFADWSYKWYNKGMTTKYSEVGKTLLDPEDDAATVYWGIDWKMPTRAQLQELLNNTDTMRITLNGVNGIKFLSKKDSSKFVFLPFSGRRSGGYFVDMCYSGGCLKLKDFQ